MTIDMAKSISHSFLESDALHKDFRHRTIMLGDLPAVSSVLYLLGAFCIFSIVYSVGATITLNARIARLGARAPKWRSYFPYGLDHAYAMIRSSQTNTTLELWTAVLRKHQYTVEAGVGERVILTAEPENIKAILATQFKDYGKGEQFHEDWFPFLGNGIFSTDGLLWHNSRQLIRPQFIKDRLSDLDIFEQHVQVLISKLKAYPEANMLDLFYRYALDAATHFLLGQSVESLHIPQMDFASAFDNVQRVQSLVSKLGPLNWLVPRRRLGFYDSLRTMNAFVNAYVERALALSSSELDEKSDPHSQGYTFLHAIAAYTRDPQMLRDQLVNILLAGRDTTACSLAWCIYELSLNPAATAKLRQEIVTLVGLDKAPTYDDLKGMKYMQHVLNETLRLYPAVPYNVRVALHDTTLPTGGGPRGDQPIGILKGTPIGYSTLLMQRRPNLYPSTSSSSGSPLPHPEVFAPERWDHWQPRPWEYIPFNGGPRICIGQQFALAEMGYTLVRLFQAFEAVENRMGGEKARTRTNIILQPSVEIKVAFR